MEFQPRIIKLSLPCDPGLIQAVEKELNTRASIDDDKCYGYFPGMKRDGIDNDLPISQKFAKQAGTLLVNKKSLNFNFLRLSLVDQPTISPFHLDSDSATALTGDMATMATRLVWRLLLNLNSTKSRIVTYLDLNPSQVELKNEHGYISCPANLITSNTIRNVELAHRRANKIEAVLFCASRVLHAGKDINGGHFIAGYGLDEQSRSADLAI